MSETLPRRRKTARVAIIAVVVVLVGAVIFFAARPRLHPPLAAGDVERLRCFTDADRHYEWLVFDRAVISNIVGWFNAGTEAKTDVSPQGEVPTAGILFILANGNGITISTAGDGATGEVMVARGQYQYRLTAPELAAYIGALGTPAELPPGVVAAADRLVAFLTARGAANLAAQEALCTANGQRRLAETVTPTRPIYTELQLRSATQEEYSPWVVDQTGATEALVVWAEWDVSPTEYGRQYLGDAAEAGGQGRLTFLLVRFGADEPWLIEDWQ